VKSGSITKKIRSMNLRNYVVYLSFFAILFLFSIILRDKGFLSGDNLMNILRQTAMVSVMAVGMTFTITAGEIDLSLGGTVLFRLLSQQ